MDFIDITSESTETENNNFLGNIIDYEEYYLMKDKQVLKFTITKKTSDIVIKSNNYAVKLNDKSLSVLIHYKFDSLDHAYKTIINAFEDNRITIKEFTSFQFIKLKVKINKKNEFEIKLPYGKNHKVNFIVKELSDQIISLKEEIKDLNEKIEILKKASPSIQAYTNPKNIKLSCTLIKDLKTRYTAGNAISVFKSIDDILYLIYAQNNSIISYDIINKKQLKEIENAHKQSVIRFNNFFDDINKRDLLLSISVEENEIKLWNIQNYECLLHLQNINQKGKIFSACFLNDDNNNYIIASNHNVEEMPELIKIYDFKGNKIKEINDSNDLAFYIDNYYDNFSNKLYILTATTGLVKAFDYNENKLYHKYSDGDSDRIYVHEHIIVYDTGEIITMLESCIDGYVRMWDFHSCLLLKKFGYHKSYKEGVSLLSQGLLSMCLWNNDYLFVSASDRTIRLINVKSGKIIKIFDVQESEVITIKKIIHSKYGQFLLTFDLHNVSLWENH